MELRRARSDEFGIVLALLLTAYVLFMFSGDQWVRSTVSLLYAAALVFAIRTSRPSRRQQLVVRLVAAAAVVAAALAALLLDEQDATGVANLAFTALLLTTLVIVVDRVLRHHGAVTLQTIAGALSAYMLLGFLFAAVFGVVDWLQDGTFFVNGEEANATTLQYFSFTTLTTVGYGDYTAASASGRGMATFEALMAQIFLATLIARLVAALPVRGRRLEVVQEPGEAQDENAEPTKEQG